MSKIEFTDKSNCLFGIENEKLVTGNKLWL